MKNQHHILIVDDHLLNIAGITQFLEDDYENIISANTLVEAKERIANEKIDLVLLDLMMVNEYSFELLNFINIKHPKIRVIIISSLINVYYVKKCLNTNVCRGYVSKNINKTILTEAITSVFEDLCYTTPDVAEQLSFAKSKSNYSDRAELFSRREKEVLSGIYKEETNQEIADLLGISIRTVEVHKRTIQKKIGAKNIVGVIKFVEENKFFLLKDDNSYITS